MKKMMMMCAVVLATMAAFAQGLYCVIDLSGGTEASSYPITYRDDVPSGGWSDEYKTTKLVLRKIPAGTFTMGSPTDELGRGSDEDRHEVTLTNNYYIGVFPVTQRQWELAMGARPSYFNNDTYYAPRPVEQVTYNMIRGLSAGKGWPNSSDVDATSFLGVLRAKSGLALDLPTEAQWEYACRAGTTTALNSGVNLTNAVQDAEMDRVGRYNYNGGSGSLQECDWSHGTAKVGSYAPNAWGLYDMHGNVWEWCLDWYGSYAGDETDPKGPSSGSERVMRGGGWGNNANYCRSAKRYCSSPAITSSLRGFRLCCPAALPEGGPYTETVEGIEWTFMVRDGKASVGAYRSWAYLYYTAVPTETTGDVFIPSVLGGRDVTGIDGNAFLNCSNMTSITLPASIESIGTKSFCGCRSLADMYFIGDNAPMFRLSVEEESFVWPGVGACFCGCNWDLIMHVPSTWKGRGRTLYGYTVLRDGEETDVRMTVTNVVVHYIQTSELSPMAAPITPDVGIVNVMTEIEGGIVAVPESWATNYPSFKQKFGDDFAVALTRETGKFDANRKPMYVWQDYVAGTDPTNVKDQFRASVTMVGGKPVISFTPVLSEKEAAKRVYTIYGKVKLQDETWTPIPEGQEADYNFFKVTVKMK